MNFLSNIKIQGFFQIIQSIFIVLLYNVLAIYVFPPEINKNTNSPNLEYIFSSQIIGFLLTGITLIFLYKVKFDDDFFSFDFDYKNVFLVFMVLIIFNIINLGYNFIFEKLLPPYLMQSYLSMQSDLMNEYLNLTEILSNFHPSFLYLVGGLLPAICEEFFFRGYLLNLSLRYYSKTFAVILTSFIFAIVHLQIVVFIPLFIFGILLSMITIRTKKLIYSLILHFINNSITLYLLSNQI